MTSSLYEILGKKPAVESLVKLFYSKIVSDETLTKYFNNVDIKKIIDHQILFISEVLGGPKAFPKIELEKAHANLNITDKDFDTVANHLDESLKELNIEDKYIKIILDKVESLRPVIVNLS